MFNGKQVPSSKFAHRRFIGSEESMIGQKEKLECIALQTGALTNLLGVLDLRWPFGVALNLIREIRL